MKDSTALIEIEVIDAFPDRVWRHVTRVAQGSCVGDVLQLPEVAAYRATIDERETGVFGKLCDASRVLHDDDRVELYRPITHDAKVARRERAEVTRAARARRR